MANSPEEQGRPRLTLEGVSNTLRRNIGYFIALIGVAVYFVVFFMRFAGGYPVLFNFITSPDHIITFLYIPIFFIVGYIVQREIENRRRRSEIIKELSLINQFYRDIFVTAPIGIYTIDQKGAIDSFNPKMVQLSGAKNAKEIIGLNIFEMPSYTDAGLDDMMREGLNGKPFQFETKYISQESKKESYRRYYGQPIKSLQTGEVERLMLLVEDITEAKKLERMRSDFITILTHQLRTPLTGTKWITKLLQKKKLPKEENEQIEQIYQSNERMINMVNELMRFSKFESPKKLELKKERKDIKEILDREVSMQRTLAKKKDVVIKAIMGCEKNHTFFIDADQLRHVFHSLIENAIRYSREGSIVEISCKHTPHDIQFSVQDQGIGIPPEEQGYVFEKFFRGKEARKKEPEGVGIGLHLAKTIIQLHGGRIWFASEEGRGTTFTFSIPVEHRMNEDEE